MFRSRAVSIRLLHGASDQAYYRWKAKSGGLKPSRAQTFISTWLELIVIR